MYIFSNIQNIAGIEYHVLYIKEFKLNNNIIDFNKSGNMDSTFDMEMHLSIHVWFSGQNIFLD